jgi:hypothetical protein
LLDFPGAFMQRGRKSTGLAALNVTGKPSRLTPPSSLNDDEQALFSELVGACDASHFRESDLPLLISYVQSTLISRAAARDPDRIALWEKATRMQATLATRLRLSPQSRIDPKTVGRHQLNSGRKPWDPIE